jgi:hypothetical protein
MTVRTNYTQGQAVFMTPEGGLARLFVNKTGAASVKGTLLHFSATVPNAVEIIPANNPDPIGVIYNDGILDGGMVWVVYYGPAYVLLEDNTIATTGYWCVTSAVQAGRVNATQLLPPGGTLQELVTHFKEAGHCMESATAGIDKLVLVNLHFN